MSAAGVITTLLMLLLLYAAYDHGAAGLSAGARLQTAAAALAAVVAAGVLWTGSLRLAAPRRALLAIGLLGGFALWSAVTLAWSVSPDATWTEFNRVLTYLLVLGIAVVVGASHRDAIVLVARGFLVVAMAVAVYGLGQKLVPGLHIGGLIDLNRTGQFARLQEPLGYWNALALLLAMAVPTGLAIAVDRSAANAARLAALIAIELLLLAIVLTLSRGGLLALAFGAGIGITVSGARLRSLMWAALVLLCTLAPLLIGLTDHSLTTSNVGLGARESGGAELAAVLGVSLLVLTFMALRLFGVERHSRIGPERARRIGKLVALLAAVAVVVGVIAVALSGRGLTGTISHAWNSFTATKGTSVSNPGRLLSVDSENRWVWWEEAVGAFSDRPFGGWGAGSFATIHLLYRHNALATTQAHSVPLQFLAETGIVGAGLAIGAFGLLLATATAAVRRLATGRERLLAAALLAGAATYIVHALYDWDWAIPGVTLPALVFLGVLAGSAARSDAAGGRPTLWRGLALVGVTLTLCLIAFSGVLPSLAASRAGDALLAAAQGTPAALSSAASEARQASSFDPLSDQGLLVETTIAIKRKQLGAARADIVQAIGREPTDMTAWEQLFGVELRLGNARAQLAVAQRMLALNPFDKFARGLADQDQLRSTPPDDSATAITTPAPSLP
jgi:O-antigen ligase